MRYLVATDGSEESTYAVSYAAKHAASFGATLEIVHVITPETELVDGEIVFQGQDSAMDEGHRTLEAAMERAADVDATLEIETQLLTGRPADAITERASAAAVDAIYVGHRGLAEKQEQVVGSVAKNIVSKSPVPVTVVK